jgi:hypothetical protein
LLRERPFVFSVPFHSTSKTNNLSFRGVLTVLLVGGCIRVGGEVCGDGGGCPDAGVMSCAVKRVMIAA